MIKAIVFDAYGTLFDVQSVADATEAAFPGKGEYVTQVWRLKQLEYSWLRSMTGRYEDFWSVTCESLAYAARTLGAEPDRAVVEHLAGAYNRLTPYPEAKDALMALSGHSRAILSNGSPEMLTQLVRASGLEGHLDAVLSVDPTRAYKPDPRAYEPVEARLGVPPGEAVFVTSNGFDIMGAKAFGFRVARIERLSPPALAASLAEGEIGPVRMYQALRTQEETCGARPDVTVSSLLDLVEAVAQGRI